MKYLLTLMIMIVSMSFMAAPAAASPLQVTDSAVLGGTIIKPGETKTNGDGVTVTNDKDSKKNATMTPKKGSGDSKTKVKLGSGTNGDVSGLDYSDSVDVGNGSDVTISGTGGNIRLRAGVTAVITNTLTAGNKGTIFVTTPSGVDIEVPAGSSTTINT